VALALAAGCAPAALTPAGARVEVSRAPRAGCVRVVAVAASAGYNGRSPEANAAAAETALRNDAAASAANAIVITSRRLGAVQGADALSRPTGAMVSGGCPNCVAVTADAYRCPETAPARAPVETPATFAESAAEAALAAAADSARQCGVSAEAKIRVTFATTGDVVYAEAEGDGLTGTPGGACVARKLRNAHVPAFTGEARSLSRTLTIAPGP
jgi:hypothetical protein